MSGVGSSESPRPVVLPTPSELAASAADDILWDAYRATEVEIDGPAGTAHIRPQLAATEGRPPLPSLHVITACNPGSVEDLSGNLARMAELRQCLGEYKTFPARGFSPDRSHIEESVAVVGLEDAEACDIGLRFGQVAVFAWRGPLWSVLACASDRRTDLGWRVLPGG